MTSDSGSMRKPMVGANSPIRAHVHSVCVKERVSTGLAMRRAPTKQATAVETATGTVPRIAMATRPLRLPAITKATNPATGVAGTSHSHRTMSSSQQ
jgi:hypothetical protein